MSPLERPKAPASRASPRSASIVSLSCGSGGRASKPIPALRSSPCPPRGSEVLREGPPAHGDPHPPRTVREVAPAPGPVGGPARAAVPDDLRRDALADRVVRGGTGEQGEVGVGVDVDEARSDEEAFRVEDLRSLPPGHPADLR